MLSKAPDTQSNTCTYMYIGELLEVDRPINKHGRPQDFFPGGANPEASQGL